MRVISVQTGRGKKYPPAFEGERPWTSAIAKEPVSGPLRLGLEGLEGDVQVDRRYHGGPERALLAYSADHYAGWRAELQRESLPPGSFGENLTVEGANEATICIGDSLALGSAVVQVSQPRMPCVKLARRLATPDMVQRALASLRTGIYLRVLREGEIAAGELTLVERPFPQFTVAFALQALLGKVDGGELLACPLLAEEWRSVVERAARHRAAAKGA